MAALFVDLSHNPLMPSIANLYVLALDDEASEFPLR